MQELLKLQNRYPNIPILDLIYYEMKGLGVAYVDDTDLRPKMHIIDNNSMFSFVPLIPTSGSPYRMDFYLKRKGDNLPVRVRLFPWIKGKLDYFYLRGSEQWIQTLDSETVLNTNFNPKCHGCRFCSRRFDQYASNRIPSINPDEGIQLVIQSGIKMNELAEIAIVTGNFNNSIETISHISAVLKGAKSYGFKGRLFYLGCQICTRDDVNRLFNAIDSTSFRYAYTVETFMHRDMLHPAKATTIQDCLSTLECLKASGIENLEYTYIPGLDTQITFDKWAPLIKDIAKPHVSIFRPAISEHFNLLAEDYVSMPVEYLCIMRLKFEQLYGGPIYGNNLGNLWPFPLNRIHSKFSPKSI